MKWVKYQKKFRSAHCYLMKLIFVWLTLVDIQIASIWQANICRNVVVRIIVTGDGSVNLRRFCYFDNPAGKTSVTAVGLISASVTWWIRSLVCSVVKRFWLIFLWKWNRNNVTSKILMDFDYHLQNTNGLWLSPPKY